LRCDYPVNPELARAISTLFTFQAHFFIETTGYLRL
jgi:hypothetical protein